MTSQWKTTLRKDSVGSTIVGFSFEGERGHIQMDDPAGSVDTGDLADDQLDRLRSRAKSCTISWMDDAGVDWVVEVRVMAGRIMVYKVNGAALGKGALSSGATRGRPEVSTPPSIPGLRPSGRR